MDGSLNVGPIFDPFEVFAERVELSVLFWNDDGKARPSIAGAPDVAYDASIAHDEKRPKALACAGLKSLSNLKTMARLDGETSNALFETLGDWNAYLAKEKIDLRGPQP